MNESKLKFNPKYGLLPFAFAFLSCTSQEQFETRLSRTLKENPKVLLDAINEHPTQFALAVQKSMSKAKEEMALKRQEDGRKKLDKYFNDPLTPSIGRSDAIRGKWDAPITIVEYIDYECPFCSRSASTLSKLKEEFGDKIRIVTKHLPLDIHPNAMIAAQYFEGLRLQSSELAFKFQEEIFSNQTILKGGEASLIALSRKIGANISKLSKTVSTKEVKQKISKDQSEAQKLGLQGTPGFVLNGIPIKGAYPVDHFKWVISELQKRQKLTL